MIIDKDFAGLEKRDGYYFYDGDIYTTEHLEIKVNLRVSGSIRADGYIISDGSIRADGSIISGGNIRLDGSIRAVGYIMSAGSIRAGGKICAHKIISYGEIRSGVELTYREPDNN